MERTDKDVDAYLAELGSQDVTTLDAHIADVFAGTERVLWKRCLLGRHRAEHHRLRRLDVSAAGQA